MSVFKIYIAAVFMSPEVLDGEEGYGLEADIWSLGITTIEIADRKPPFHDMSTMKVRIFFSFFGCFPNPINIQYTEGNKRDRDGKATRFQGASEMAGGIEGFLIEVFEQRSQGPTAR